MRILARTYALPRARAEEMEVALNKRSEGGAAHKYTAVKTEVVETICNRSMSQRGRAVMNVKTMAWKTTPSRHVWQETAHAQRATNQATLRGSAEAVKEGAGSWPMPTGKSTPTDIAHG
ncbi:hypothetical protein NDU88_002418 [Pleurodeles waltl]|uniref:Uncharacterized protein n=1 Tax=Pleurodeles waltl TaxID=8319 RepID=A0AAV7MQG8_PLEWA|nr:hypothetical protein NDU88_002418 [Pleurodeles waltl]